MRILLAGLILVVDVLAAGLCWLSLGQQDAIAAGYFLGVLALATVVGTAVVRSEAS